MKQEQYLIVFGLSPLLGRLLLVEESCVYTSDSSSSSGNGRCRALSPVREIFGGEIRRVRVRRLGNSLDSVKIGGDLEESIPVLRQRLEIGNVHKTDRLLVECGYNFDQRVASLLLKFLLTNG